VSENGGIVIAGYRPITTVALPRASSNALVQRLERRRDSDEVARMLRSPQTNQPIRLDWATRNRLIAELAVWSREDGIDSLPEGIYALRNALMADAAYPPAPLTAT
jgi:hypothetical protein